MRAGLVRRACGMALGVGMALMGGVAQGQGANPPGVQPLVVYEHAPMSAWLVDEKDAALREALALLPRRLAELPGEIPDMPAEVEPLLQLALRTLAQPARVSITYNPDNAMGGFFGYGLTLSVAARDKAHAEQLHGVLHEAMSERMRQGGMPAPAESMRFANMRDIGLPFGLISYGPREGNEGWRYEVIVGAVDNPDAGFDRLPDGAQGFRPVVRAALDLSALTPAVNMVRTMAGREMPQEGNAVISELEAGGVIGPNAMRGNYVAGYTETEMVSVMRLLGAAKHAERWRMAREPLAARDLAAVPADATMVSLAKGDLAMLVDVLDKLAERGLPVAEHLAEFKAMTGVDLRTDILETVGGTWGAYMSDATGGGSLGSGVLFASLKDRGRFSEAHRKLVAAASKAIGEQEHGRYVRLATWKDGDAELVSLRFPGVPVPLEVTYAVAGDWVVAGLTPQATMVGARQAMGKGDRGLTANAAFGAAMPKGREVTSVSFVDVSRTMRNGYTIVSMAGSAAANLVRSPAGGRDVGVLVPPYGELVKGARPTIKYSYWDGEDLVTEAHADRSALVNAAGTMGAGASFWPLFVAIPAIAEGAKQGRMGMADVPGLRGSRETMLAMLAMPETWMDPARRDLAVMAIGVMAAGR